MIWNKDKVSKSKNKLLKLIKALLDAFIGIIKAYAEFVKSILHIAVAKWCGLLELARKWFVTYQNHRVVFTRTEDFVQDEKVREAVQRGDTITWEELERMSADSPYVAAVYDQEQEIILDLQGINPEQGLDEKLAHEIERQDGFIILSA